LSRAGYEERMNATHDLSKSGACDDNPFITIDLKVVLFNLYNSIQGLASLITWAPN
jgi:hypothetical protein